MRLYERVEANENENFVSYAPSSATDVVLSTDYKSGRNLKIFNDGTAIISLKASNNSLIRQIYPGTHAEMMALVDSPINSSGWRSLNKVVSGWIDTPTIIINDWTEEGQTSRYRRDGKQMYWEFSFQGFVTSFSVSVNLFDGLTHNVGTNSNGEDIIDGDILYNEDGSNEYTGCAVYVNSGAFTLSVKQVTGSYIRIIDLNTTVPHTWASGDEVKGHVVLNINEWEDYSN